MFDYPSRDSDSSTSCRHILINNCSRPYFNIISDSNPTYFNYSSSDETVFPYHRYPITNMSNGNAMLNNCSLHQLQIWG